MERQPPEPTEAERAWLETAPVGGVLSMKGPQGIVAFGIGTGNLEWSDYIRIDRWDGVTRVTRLK